MKRVARHTRSFFRLLRGMLIDGLIRRGRREEMPRSLIIEPSNICNLRCSCCPQGSDTPAGGRARGVMSRETFLQALRNIDLPVREICLYLHGEPFLNKNLDFFVSQIDRLGKVLTTIYSNGYNVDLTLLQKILAYKKVRFSFSMELLDKERYERLREPARYEEAVASLSAIDKIFAEHGRKYELTMIAGEEGGARDSCDWLFARYRQLKRVSFGARFPWPEHFYTGHLEGNISKRRKPCEQINGGVSVFWTGEVTACSYDFSGKLIIGNLTSTPLSRIYNSPRARAIRRDHLFRRWREIPTCKHCLLPRFASKTTSVNRPGES